MYTSHYYAWTKRLLVAVVFFTVNEAHANALHFQFRPLSGSCITTARAVSQEAPPKPEKILPDFGDAGTTRFSVGIAGADNFDDFAMVLARVSIELFVIDGVSVGIEGDVGYIGQSVGDDGVGAGVSIRARWHFLRRECWSMYADIAAGLFQSSVDVPAGSGQFKFYPQAGGGVSLSIAHDQRLLVGARWCHLSNARTLSENVGIDGLQIYAMLSFGF